jgi:hypothetical protein
MVRKYKLLILFLLLIIYRNSFAQSENFGTWTSISIDKKLDKWSVEAETELRTIYYFRLIDRWSLGLNADYSLNKYLKLGVGYQFMNALDYDDDYVKSYFIRNRLNLSATGKIKWNDFSFNLRERIQFTHKEDRVQTDGTIDDYNVNPAWAWRNRFQLEYNIPNCKITPAFSVESFYDLNNPDGNSFDNIRYILSLDYKINKHNHIDIYGVINSELNSDDATGKYILGISYKHSF